MNPRTRNMVLIGAGALLAGWTLIAVARNTYFTPRSAKLARIDELKSTIADRTAVNRAMTRRQIQDIADRTLGGDRETVDHQLRSHLNQYAQQLDLNGATVGTAGSSARLSPARTIFSRRGLQGEMREMIDLIELEGWINAEGTLEQALALVDRLEASPWISRLDQVKLAAKDGGRRCAVSVRLTTLMVPGFGPSEPPVVQQYENQRLARFDGLLSANPFALPAPPPEPVRVVEKPEPSPPPRPEFPYGQWSLTGTALGPDGVEAWLLQSSTGETRRLLVGESIGMARLLAAEGENARFELNQRQFLVSIGASLDDRAPVNP